MTTGLIRMLLEAHVGDDVGGGSARAPAAELALRIDHAILCEPAAQLVLPALRVSPSTRARVPLALLCADPRRTPGSLEPAGAKADLDDTARALGVHVVPPGAGHAEAIYLDHFAAPGRIAIMAGAPIAAAGALGMLALDCGELDLAAALRCGVLVRPAPAVLGVELRGTLPQHIGGCDLAAEIVRRLPPGGARGVLVEMWGGGVEHLAMSDRIACVVACAERAGLVAVFPSDDVTHSWLRARGRDSDWKRLEAGPLAGEGVSLAIDLEGVEPHASELGRAGNGRVLRADSGPEVRRVLCGPGAARDDLERLAMLFEGRALHPGVELVIVPGSRERLAGLSASGVLGALVGAGARVLELGAAPVGGVSAGLDAIGVCCGARARDLDETRTRWWAASPASCAQAALMGRLLDPRALPLVIPRDDDSVVTGSSSSWILAPEPEPDPGGESSRGDDGGFPLAPPISGALRGVVLIKAGDRIAVEQVLPWGARMIPLAGDIYALTEHAFEPIDPGFAGRARAHGGGFVLSGEAMGQGSSRVQAALVLVALGVRAAIARSWENAFRCELVQAGVLPLRLARAADYDRLSSGDELELPTLPEGLEPGRPLVVRNLTRGTQIVAVHDLSAREIAIARAGGLLPFIAGEAHAPRRDAA